MVISEKKSPQTERRTRQEPKDSTDCDYADNRELAPPRVSPGFLYPVFHKAVIADCLIDFRQPFPLSGSMRLGAIQVEVRHYGAHLVSPWNIAKTVRIQ
jgi:hypothetical protein